MARAKNIDLEALARAGARALGALGWLDFNDLPPRHQRPEVFKMILEGLARDLPSHQANSRAFRQAMQATSTWAAAQELADKAARLYHDPTVRALAGNDESTMRWFLEHPDEAMKQLAAHAVEHPKAYQTGPLREVLEAIGSYETFHDDYSSDPGPTEALAQQTSGARLDGLPSPGAGRSDTPQAPIAEERAPGPGKPSTSTYEKLVNTANLTPAQWSTLMAEAERRHPAVATEYDDLPPSYFGETETETPTNG